MEDLVEIRESEERKFPLNYFFFLFSFFILFFVHGLHVFLIEPQFTFSKYFFLMQALAQSLIEVLGFICIFHWIQSIFTRRIKSFLVSLGFLLVICRIVDFFLERLMDISIWYSLSFVMQESTKNFIEILKATNIPMQNWIFAAFVLAGVIYLGIILYKTLDYFSKKRPFYFSKRFAFSTLIASVFFLFIWDITFSSVAHGSLSKQYQKALPWKGTFFAPKHEVLILDGCLKDLWRDKSCLGSLDSRAFSLQHKPDIFLFVAESLREDFITDAIAPNLANFRTENISFPLALSNANATHISWFSLFYSLFPFYFPQYQVDQWNKGSIPLLLLKKMGYDIHLYSASRLGFYNMEQVLFGKDGYLLSSKHCFGNQEGILPWQADHLAIEKLCSDLQKNPKGGGRVFVVFLESTHFGYSFPCENSPKFTPMDRSINYLEAAVSSKNVEKIKNRYRNAMNYIDTLFGTFLAAAKNSPSWEESVVVFTADHGEEFFERGHLFHATDLSKEQLHVPLYYKMGTQKTEEMVEETKLSCHMDVFPSIMHYITGENHFHDVMQGKSIFSKGGIPYVVGARYNAGKSPYEFFIHNGSQKLIAQFDNKDDVFHSRSLNIIATKNEGEENIPFSFSIIHQYFGEALNSLFSP